MASSDPPFDAADDPTTQPLRRPDPAPADANERPAAEGDEAGATAQPLADEAGAEAHEPPAEAPAGEPEPREPEPREPEPREDAHGPAARSVLRQNTNWFEHGFGAEDVAPMAPTQPGESPAPETSEAVPANEIESVSQPAREREHPVERPVEPSAEPPVELPVELSHERWHEPPVESSPELTGLAPPRSADPIHPQLVEPSGMDAVAAEIATALTSPESEHAPTRPAAVAFVDVPVGVAPAPIQALRAIPAPHFPQPAPAQPTRLPDLVVRAGKVAGIVFCAWFCVVLVLIALYRFINPPFSSLMAMQWLGGTTIHQDWVPLEAISPNLIHAVVVSEDGRFCEHWGIDFVEIAEALRRTPHGPPRGASTITMQVAKNLFLWPAKSYVRKVIEVPLTFAIELFWPKRRILEVYLNIAEWGPGIFGAEAASQAHFNRSASRLSERQAAQLAVALPNPLIRDAGAPGPRTAHQASVIQRRTGREPEAIGCVMTGE